MGKASDIDGQWVPIDRYADEVRREKAEKAANNPPPPAKQEPPPVPKDPGAEAKVDVVDEFYLAELGKAVLPNQDSQVDFMRLAREGFFSGLAQRVVDGLRLDFPGLKAEAERFNAGIAKAESELNKKEAPAHPADEEGNWPGLPGVKTDQVCLSSFDVHDLALTDRKSVTTRSYHQPLIFSDTFVADPRERWRFGQKLELRQEWRHAGFTLGDHISSISLLPGEELTMEVNSWQRTKTEISNETDDAAKKAWEYQSRTTDEAACTNEMASDMGWSVSASGGVTFPIGSASLSTSLAGSTSERTEQSRRSVQENTSRSTNEVSSRRAVKITQTSEFGSESTTTRRIRNPNGCHTVTFNFFQIVKLYDIQLRLVSDDPMIVLPGIFPRFYGPLNDRKGEGAPPVEINVPTYLIESWSSPAVFLTTYFTVDREVSQQVLGFALRVRFDPAKDAERAVRFLAEAIIIACKYLLIIDPAANLPTITNIVGSYVGAFRTNRAKALAQYGKGKGQTEQLNTTGVYVDALRGRCSACEDVATASAYVDVMSRHGDMKWRESLTELNNQEVERRRKRLAADDLESFGPMPDGGAPDPDQGHLPPP